ncbi:MAG: hypothetical protein ABFR33_00170 [Verrucomicrobiota bacterium]
MLKFSYILSTCLAAALAFAVEPGEVDIDATYFHPAASMYIHGDATSASNLVAKGLSLFPEDGKLLRLKELLEQQQEQQQNEDQDQSQDQDKQQDQKDQQEQQQDQQEEQQNQEQQDQQQEQPEPPSAEEMSEDEAKQLLDAMRQEEQNKRLQLHPVMGAPVKVDKDW